MISKAVRFLDQIESLLATFIEGKRGGHPLEYLDHIENRIDKLLIQGELQTWAPNYFRFPPLGDTQYILEQYLKQLYLEQEYHTLAPLQIEEEGKDILIGYKEENLSELAFGIIERLQQTHPQARLLTGEEKGVVLGSQCTTIDLLPTQDLAPKHCLIRGEGDHFNVTNLTKDSRVIWQGQHLHTPRSLESGITLEIDQFQVALWRLSQQQIELPASPADSPESKTNPTSTSCRQA